MVVRYTNAGAKMLLISRLRRPAEPMFIVRSGDARVINFDHDEGWS